MAGGQATAPAAKSSAINGHSAGDAKLNLHPTIRGQYNQYKKRVAASAAEEESDSDDEAQHEVDLVNSNANCDVSTDESKSHATDLGLSDEDREEIEKMLGLRSTGNLTDKQLHIHYFEIQGDNMKFSPVTGSRANIANLLHVMKMIKGPLHELYGNEMLSFVGLITPYQRQFELYFEAFGSLREQGWPEEALPGLFTVGRAYGKKFDHVIIDVVDTSYDHVEEGFMEDHRNALIAFTCGYDVLWVVGGTFSEPPASHKFSKENRPKRYDRQGIEMSPYPVVFYRDEFAKQNALSHHPDPNIHATAWPLDYWAQSMQQALANLRTERFVRRYWVNMISLSEAEQKTVMSEASARGKDNAQVGHAAHEAE